MAGAACQVRPGRRRAQRRSQHTHTAASASHLDTPLGPCPCPCPCRGRGSRGRGRGGCGRGGGPCRPSRAPSLPLAASRHARGRAAAAQPRAASRHRRHRHLHQVAEVGEEGRRPSRHTPALCDITTERGLMISTDQAKQQNRLMKVRLDDQGVSAAGLPHLQAAASGIGAGMKRLPSSAQRISRRVGSFGQPPSLSACDCPDRPGTHPRRHGHVF